MKVALALLSYAVLLGTVGLVVLRRARWVDRAPRLGLLAWLTLVTSMVASIVLGGLSLAVPTGWVSSDLATLLHACVMALRTHYESPGGAVVGAIGAVTAVTVVARLVYWWLAASIEESGLRRNQHRTLAMIGRHDPHLDVMVVDHDVVAAYCLPGRRHRVVLTSTALESLASDELAAVLAHERAHLRGRHHIVTTVATTLARAFPFVPAFVVARAEITRLVELLADDAATRSCSRLAVADALLGVAAASTPAGALGAGGSTTASRVRRLLAPHTPLNWSQRLAAATAAVTVFTIPALVAATPAIAAMQLSYCPIT